jgi:hypothetical protein
MTFKDLIFKFSSETIINRLVELYPDQHKESYLEAISELKTLKSIKTIMQISVKEYGDVEDKKDYVDVCGINKEANNWALDFMDWREVLSMKITQDSINNFSLLDIVCHCLWEITFNGYSNTEIQAQFKELKDLIDEIKKEEKK